MQDAKRMTREPVYIYIMGAMVDVVKVKFDNVISSQRLGLGLGLALYAIPCLPLVIFQRLPA
jgi:hypothetical protein